ncbi:MAG TPA: Vps62-related protein [Polyangia bacterium]
MSFKDVRRPRRSVVASLFALVLVFGFRGFGRHEGSSSALRAARAATRTRAPRPLARDDSDRDGLSDALEEALAARYAPAVVLAPGERNRPASTRWLLSRVAPPGMSAQDFGRALVAGQLNLGGADFSDEVRAGSGDSRDWVTYVHVYPRVDGGINVQYWFFYPYNQAPLFFDHEGDWEHITVDLGPGGAPRAVYFSEHGNNNPGVYRAWERVRRVGDHPIVLSARGTHASYPEQASVAWFDHVSQCRSVDGCADPVWRTWAAGGLANVGERGAAAGEGEVLAYGGGWGGGGHLLRSRAAPQSPPHQGGFSTAGFD